MDIRFCYKVSSEAGAAYDTETGENAEAYLQVKFGDAKKLPSDYQESHKRIGSNFAKENGWEESWVIPISEEEYDEETEEE